MNRNTIYKIQPNIKKAVAPVVFTTLEIVPAELPIEPKKSNNNIRPIKSDTCNKGCNCFEKQVAIITANAVEIGTAVSHVT